MQYRKAVIIVVALAGMVSATVLLMPKPFVWLLLPRPSEVELRAAFPPGARDILEHSPTLTLYSFGWDGKDNEWFHGWPVAGKTTLRGFEKRFLLDSLYATTSRLPMMGGSVAGLCFSPNCGLRAVDPKSKKEVVLVPSFGCHNAEIYVDNQRQWFAWQNDHLLNEAMDEVFRRENIPISTDEIK